MNTSSRAFIETKQNKKARVKEVLKEMMNITKEIRELQTYLEVKARVILINKPLDRTERGNEVQKELESEKKVWELL